MPKSMTGYGRAELQDSDWTVIWEVKSVNSRFLDLKWRAPYYLRALETSWEKTVRGHASRGRVDLFLNVQLSRSDVLDITLNLPMAEAMINQVRDLAERTGTPFQPDYNRILTMSSLWQDSAAEPDPRLADSLQQCLTQALANWNAMREREGEVLAGDLKERLELLRGYVSDIQARLPDILREKSESLRTRIKGMLDDLGAEYSEDRMLQEIAVLTDRLDVSEEMTRLAAHMAQLERVLTKGGDAGKRLDFLMQETFREINTCGNKCQDAEISRIVVNFKAELERCREQVQNIE